VALADELGLARPRTLLATGNLIFEAAATDERALETALEPAFAARLGRPVDIIVRAGDRWLALMRGNPFAEAAEREPARVAVRVMRTAADAGALARLEPYRVEGERIAVVDGDIWVHLPHGTAGSRLAGAITPARAGGAGTFRNWNTVRRIGNALGLS
jgi:uncharacterized protein (DUF1697 family)